jgi:azurin
MKFLPSLLPLVVGSALCLAGCSKSEAPATPAAASAPADGAVSVEITANDTMKFNVTEIRAIAGAKVSVTLTNLGNMPKQAMGHNWVLFAAMTDPELAALVQAAASRPSAEYLPADTAKILAHTKLLGAKESDTVVFTAPAQPGDYPFVCTFPGHAALMRGKLIVTAAKP